MAGYSRWSRAAVCGVDRLSPVDFEVRQDEQGSQEVGGVGGVGAELGEDPPVLEVGEAMFEGGVADGEGRTSRRG
ncbi:hypothetical protein GCM10023336_62780 [Streptomyces similanensis]|uniref:Uncharacterized protein n=1 Tax=Streptomyces similanensis TaxID=1274988 RepID=A0ABP9LE72_9ACTN